MTRKITAALLVLMLMLSAVAFAGGEITGTYVLDETISADLNRESGTIAYKAVGASFYTLIDAQGNALTSAAYIAMNDNGKGFDVALEEGLNIWGYISEQGQELMPMAYGDIEVIDENWQIGVVLESATAENYDYRSFSSDEYYLVSAYDVYYQGARVGTLGRMDYSSSTAYGKYLYVQDRNSNSAYYDSAFNKSGYADSTYNEYAFDSSNGVVWHPGSNQQAFTAGCTLTAEDVKTDLYFVDGNCLDLQGNVVFAQGAYTPSGTWKGDYHKVRGFNNLYGLIDRSGNLVLPCEYDAIWEGTYDGYFGSGYQAVVKEGKFGYVDLSANVTCPFTYSESVVSFAYSPVTKLQNMEGNYILLSAAVGELPGSYAYVHTYEGCPLIEVEDAEGNKGVMDIWGNMLIPFEDDSSFNIAHDGSVIVRYADYRTYNVYTVSYTDEGAVVTEETTKGAELTAGETAEGWTCACGAVNTGNFCTDCGSAKPEESADDGSWTCSCGAANTGNFCTDCGSAKPAGEVVCKECGYKPEGDAPKFCPDCGTQF